MAPPITNPEYSMQVAFGALTKTEMAHMKGGTATEKYNTTVFSVAL